MASEALKGRGVLVTRPGERAANLARLVEQAGGRAFLFPAIAIEDLPPPAALGELERFDLAVFVSPTAVSKVMDRVGAWPRGVRAATVGGGTRRELERRGVAGVIAPQGQADSEALLALAEMQQVAGKRIVIFRGEGGREVLAEELRRRGARVEYAECYRRTRPAARRDWDDAQVHAVTVSSSQGLANLLEMLDPAFLRARPLFVPHPRVADTARAHEVREVVLAGPSDEQMRDALVAYFRSHE
ncbi:MAG TPA: uroporphyrinogen-III synthase [Burkholderiales bacterium]